MLKEKEATTIKKLDNQAKQNIDLTETPDDIKTTEEGLTLTDQDTSSGNSSCDESDLKSCSVEVSGVNKDTSQETLKMFFQSRRKTGGAKIDDLWYNKSTGNYIITFEERHGKLLSTLDIALPKTLHVRSLK